MDKATLEKMLKMMASANDPDAVMGLRGAQGLFESEGSSLSQAILFALDNIAVLRPVAPTIDHAPAAKAAAPATVNVSGMPQCRAPGPGRLEIVLAGKSGGEVVALPGAAAAEAEAIADHLKDALVAAVINKSRLKLKLLDVKNARGEIFETVLQAEYERAGMTPIRVWVNVRGEVAALATVLRKAVANALPELVAA
jgi:hypothetical protein